MTATETQDLFLPRLPQSRKEAVAIAALLPPGRAFQALDFAASRELVTGGRLSRFRILHIATHGLLRQDHPELSALVLSRFDKAGRPWDGYLRVPDIAGLSLPADLVVLSACETALGREMAGEGMEGLPQAFFTAGASRVLVSLWQVEESSTAALMETFYRGLLHKHLPAARALREAQLAIRAQPRWSAPRFWAGFVLEGDWR
jgi:CHAT domain-containing protein